MKWVGSFISNRTTTLCLPGHNTNAFPTHTGITQGSPLSPILFLFYNANLVDACNPHTLPSSGISFVDDVNTLAFSKTTEDNCRMLLSIRERCLEWAGKHGASFAPEKYILKLIRDRCRLHSWRKQTEAPAPVFLERRQGSQSRSAYAMGRTAALPISPSVPRLG